MRFVHRQSSTAGWRWDSPQRAPRCAATSVGQRCCGTQGAVYAASPWCAPRVTTTTTTTTVRQAGCALSEKFLGFRGWGLITGATADSDRQLRQSNDLKYLK